MIQIYYNYDQNGPGKVLKNLIKGLQICNEPYELNTPPREENKLLCLQDHEILRSSFISDMIIGPNICTLPIDNQVVMERKYKKIIVPSLWVKDLYKKWIPEEKIFVWPVGVDTEEFADMSDHYKPNDCLLYVKRRSNSDVEKIKSFLRAYKQKFVIVNYGSYTEEEFKHFISISKYGIVIDNCESQGLAIEEMMSCNLPLFIWDVKIWNDRGLEFAVPATNTPYWSFDCGFLFDDSFDLETSFYTFIHAAVKLKKYNSRKFILENLSLEKQASSLLELFN